jgi:hypothetical protein
MHTHKPSWKIWQGNNASILKIWRGNKTENSKGTSKNTAESLGGTGEQRENSKGTLLKGPSLGDSHDFVARKFSSFL